jgi:hypothetical protein
LPVESPITQNLKLKQMAAFERQSFVNTDFSTVVIAQLAIYLLFVIRLMLFLLHSIGTMHVIWHPKEQ